MTAEQTGQRIQEALDRLAGSGAEEAGEQLVRELMAFYGEGLARLVPAVPPPSLARLLDDPAVAGLLILHDLHPEDVTARIGRALASLPEPVELLGFDPASGTLRLRRTASGCGCGEREVEAALACHAPEVTAVRLERAPQLLQIGTRPPQTAEVR
ncbi:thioredoxin [Streptomyces kaniharaensis]|uniref:Thioredoxin n=1 Tax=Streptomyces kaniharaensis TaxID=212423 RepID=A0A6N7L085_9ACTN|nr:thioredoxin [Streptomyces kaniharaensis]MQS17041.1 thioredoxin [Streptomyces kaniharaensis]